MGDIYLHPTDSIKPVCRGCGYKDYLLSDILPVYGYTFLSGRMHFAAETVVLVAGYPRLRKSCLAVASLDGPSPGLYCAFAPANYYFPYDVGRFDMRDWYRTKRGVFPTMTFLDLTLRYYENGGHPVWVTAYTDDDRAPCEEVVSLGEHIGYCTELLSGPVVRKPKSRWDLGLESDFFEVIE